jgi:DNA invertase Pin-like site-specific DNA recombinase
LVETAAGPTQAAGREANRWQSQGVDLFSAPIRGTALLTGVEVARVYQEPGVSGSIPLEQRLAGRELLAALKPGDLLIVSKLERAFRNAADALTKADTRKRQGIRLIVADMGAEPVTDNGVAKMFFGMLALVAEFERERILERTLDGRRAKAAKRGHIGGSAPFGYQVEGSGKEARLVEIPEQQAALATIRKLREHGLPLRQIAAAIGAKHGLRVSREAIRRICKTAA